MKDLKIFFEAKSIAVIGASTDTAKLGSVILSNLADGSYKGKIYPINPKYSAIGRLKCYKSVLKVKEKIDLAIICVPAEYVISVIEDCGRKKITSVVIISAGFKEIGNIELENKLKESLKKYKINAIGPNCLGVYCSTTSVDSLFLPKDKLNRPGAGGIAFVCQSGAVGSAILDLACGEGQKFSKFVSYGNALDIDESDLIEYLGNDKNTKVICVYIEGVHNGRKFYDVLKKVCRKKPVIIIKGGSTDVGAHATLSHTGSVAGSFEVFRGVLKQCNAIEADSLEEMLEFGRIFENISRPMGSKIQIVTNGGGFGVMASDAVSEYGLKLAEMSKKTGTDLKKLFKDFYTVKNPMDLTGGSTNLDFKNAINFSLKDKNVDIVLVISLCQVPTLDAGIVDIIVNSKRISNKPVVSVITGADFSESLKKSLELRGLPCFTYPENAVRAIGKLCEYYKVKEK